MKITLIGMSNVGKTYWSKKLEEKGFIRFSCDEYIADKLGHTGIEAVSEWLRQPYDAAHKDNSLKYLDLERKALEYILSRLKNLRSEKVVIDTTGSVIYTGELLMDKLQKLTKIVYLDTPDSVQQLLHQSYLENPKPVIWGDIFHLLDDETFEEAVERCYPKLLKYRCEKYRKYAHVKLDYFLLRSNDFTVDHFIDSLR